MSWPCRTLCSALGLSYLIPVLLLTMNMMSAESKPLFGLLDLFGAAELANGTSIVSALLLNHVAHSIDKFLALADLAQYALNATANLQG